MEEGPGVKALEGLTLNLSKNEMSLTTIPDKNLENQSYQTIAEERDYYQAQKKFWSFFAPFYDLAVAPASKLREQVVDFVNAPHGAKILDVATGTGKQAFAFARQGYDVTGIDLSEAMLGIANRKNKYKNLKLQIADATHIPFETRAFDVSCVSFALHEMPLSVRERVLQELVRVTKSEGTIVIVDFALPKNKIRRFFIYNFVKLFEGEHYVKYIKNDLNLSIQKANIAITREIPILWGGARIIKGRVMP